jgi:hypothetical protein
MNWAEHAKNRAALPDADLAKYAGQHVAWSLDGSRILGGDADPLKLVADLRDQGYRSEDYVLSFVDFDTEHGTAFLHVRGHGEQE